MNRHLLLPPCNSFFTPKYQASPPNKMTGQKLKISIIAHILDRLVKDNQNNLILINDNLWTNLVGPLLSFFLRVPAHPSSSRGYNACNQGMKSVGYVKLTFEVNRVVTVELGVSGLNKLTNIGAYLNLYVTFCRLG